MRFQIERTVAAHFSKLKNVQPIGCEGVEPVFIDKVANYRAYDEDGNATLGKFGCGLKRRSTSTPACPNTVGSLRTVPARYTTAIFGRQEGQGVKAKTVWVDTSGTVAKDDSTYQLIMKDKERLLSADVPLQFIFSYLALREGWDNPNVFQICTLNETKSAMKKRQEIGRGLRLCV